jgi:hypothetical protein
MRDGATARSDERDLGIDALASLREKTEAISKLLRERLLLQLEALRPLFAPRRLLGRHVRTASRDEVPGAERAFARLRDAYAATCGRPFSLPREIDLDEPLSIDPVVEVHPYEYAHRLGGETDRVIAMTNPVRWTLCYRAGYTLAELEAALASRAPLRATDAKQFVLGSLALALLLETFPEVVRLLEDLRYEVAIEKRPDLGELPLLTLSAPFDAFRPSDAVIASATRFSGVPAFIELLDAAALGSLRDPLRDRIEERLR